MSTELVLHPRLAQWTVQALGRLLATYAILVGTVITYTGDTRWTSPAYRVALLVPGAPETWGLTLTSAGLIALAGSLAGHRRVLRCGLYIQAVWCLFFALGFLAVAVREVTVPYSVAFTYLLVAIASIVIGLAYRERS